MTVKEENIITWELDGEVEFDGHKVKRIKFDLEHINRGWDKERRDYKSTKRSNFTAEDIADFFEQLGYYSIDWDEGANKNEVEVRGKKRTRYYTFVYEPDNRAQRKMIIDIPQDFDSEGIIVTLY